MTDDRYQMVGVMKRGLAVVCLLSSVSVLPACTVMHHEVPPARAGVVPGETITVQGNKNVYAIAQQYGVSMRDIIMLNDLRPPFALKPGQSLVLPFKRDGSMMGGAVSADGMASAPLGGVQSVPLSSSIEAQPLAPVTSSGGVSSSFSPQPAAAEKHMLGQTKPSQPLDGPVHPAPQQVATTLVPLSSPASSASPPEEPESGSSTADAPKMVWPVQGPVLSGFGPKGNGVNNDGVNIGAPKGAPVVAAAGGIVVYAGNEMKGFGNLVLIRHEGGWVTAYAHLDRVLVSKDAVVAQGDMIGTVGKTGNIASPQLHFETRHGGKVVDPSGLIKS